MNSELEVEIIITDWDLIVDFSGYQDNRLGVIQEVQSNYKVPGTVWRTLRWFDDFIFTAAECYYPQLRYVD
jgi:hypothetical protein